MLNREIPRFFLYGEPARDVGDRFLHIEALDDRTRPANWNIRPHAHANLNHLFYIAEGGGVMSADGRSTGFDAPCLLIVPANVVHGFDFRIEAAGTVLTLSSAYLDHVVRGAGALGPLFSGPRLIRVLDPQVFVATLRRLTLELAWTAPAQRAMVESLLTTLLIEALRLTTPPEAALASRNGAYAALLARFREEVERSYRSERRVGLYADRLRISPKRLRAACLAGAAAPPSRILQDRVILEAKRLMLYSNMGVAEVAYYLGFDDPAYFTRVFSRRCGVSPNQFRKSPDTRPQSR